MRTYLTIVHVANIKAHAVANIKAHQGPCSRTAQLKQQMRKFYQRKELEAMQKRKANTEHKDKDTSGHAAVEIQQGKQPADNTQQMQQVPEFVDQGEKWQKQKTKLTTQPASPSQDCMES